MHYSVLLVIKPEIDYLDEGKSNQMFRRMEDVLARMPLTLSRRLSLGETLRIPASWEEFLEILPDCEYRVEFTEGTIISFVGYASENHEKLVLKVGHLLLNLLGEEDYDIFGSNLALYIPGNSHSYFNADCTVVKDAPQHELLRPGIKALTNPVLLVEVLSPSTYNFDFGLKFRSYQHIPSLRQVVLVDSSKMELFNYTKLENEKEWLLQTFDQPQDEVAILDRGKIKLVDIYRKIKFTDG